MNSICPACLAVFENSTDTEKCEPCPKCQKHIDAGGVVLVEIDTQGLQQKPLLKHGEIKNKRTGRLVYVPKVWADEFFGKDAETVACISKETFKRIEQIAKQEKQS